MKKLSVSVGRFTAAHVLLVLVSISGREARAAREPQTLESSFRAAVARTETIAVNVESINQAEERFRQSIGAVLPNIAVVGSYLRQQQPDSGSALYPAGQPLLKLQATQPLFRGFREFSGIRQNKKIVQASEEDERQARVALFNDVVLNFYTVMSLERVLSNYTSEVKAYQDRIKELQQRVRIGRSRSSEVLTVEASLSGLYAQIESTKGQIKVAREMYAFLTGFPQDTDLTDVQSIQREVPPIDFYAGGVEHRPDIRGNVIRFSASEDQMSIAKGAYLPTVDFTGNYYLHRFGATQNVKWDVQFLASFPLYAGGTIDSSVRTAASQIHQSELNLGLSRRQATEQIRASYQTYVADRQQVDALQMSRTANQKNLKAETSDYRLGLVTNLDVLNALISYYESERALDTQIYTTKLDFYRLENNAGMNPMIAPPAQPTVRGSPLSAPEWFH